MGQSMIAWSTLSAILMMMKNVNTDDPRERGRVYSKKVNLAHSTYVAKKERTLFYRRTVGDCNCILLYDGKKDLLLPVSYHNPWQRNSMADSVIKSMLCHSAFSGDYLNDFCKNGITMRGFYVSFKSKCINKFGMEQDDIISWVAWRTACLEFFNIVQTNEKEAFQCMKCGQRPKVLVVDCEGVCLSIG